MAPDWKTGKRCSGSQGKDAPQKAAEGSLMAVNRLKYSQKYEQLRAQGVSHGKAHQQAVEFATVKPAKRKPKKKKESKVRRLARLMKMAALGRHYRTPEEELPPAARRRG